MTYRRLAIVLCGLGLATAAATAIAAGALASGTGRLVIAPAIQTKLAQARPLIETSTNRDYRVTLRVSPNRPLTLGTVSVLLTRHGRVVDRARVVLALRMLDMKMDPVRSVLASSRHGRYAHQNFFLAMSGRWELRFTIRPPHAPVFRVQFVDRVGA